MSSSSPSLERLRRICLALPEAAEGVTVHHPSFKVRGKTFTIYADGESPSAWVKSTLGEQRAVVESDPDRFFVPPYLGPKGWLGVRLDDGAWEELTELVGDGYRLAAPKSWYGCSTRREACNEQRAITQPTKRPGDFPRAVARPTG